MYTLQFQTFIIIKGDIPDEKKVFIPGNPGVPMWVSGVRCLAGWKAASKWKRSVRAPRPEGFGSGLQARDEVHPRGTRACSGQYKTYSLMFKINYNFNCYFPLRNYVNAHLQPIQLCILILLQNIRTLPFKIKPETTFHNHFDCYQVPLQKTQRRGSWIRLLW